MSAAGALRPARRREAGVALLLAVWLLALLAAVVAEFVLSTRVRSAAERNRRDDLRAWTLAIAGYRAAVAALDDQIDGLSLDTDDGLRLHYPGGEKEGTLAAAKDVPLGDGTYSWVILAEDGLVNINGITQRSVFVNLLKECGLESGAERDTVIDSIIDWRDQNREHRLNGAEEDYYRGLDPPYSCKDDDFDVIEELLLVRGVTPELFFGRREKDKSYPGLRDLLSVQPFETNFGTAPKAVRDAFNQPRSTRRSPVGTYYRIRASGTPGGGAPARALEAVVRRDEAGSSRTFPLLYWNDSISPEPVGREGGN